MLIRLARSMFLVLLAAMIVVWAVSMADSSVSEPQYDPNVYLLV